MRCWPLLRRSFSLLSRISLVGFEYVFFFSNYFHVVLLRSLCICLRLESIFRGLLLCWSMFLLIWLLLSIKFSVSSFFQFEEFVDVIFPSYSWSPNRSVGPVL